MIKLVPIDSVRASNYNPRKNDEKRLSLVELSLKKLGFLLPIVADTNGEILSGHQRQLVAKRMGFRKIPVQYVDVPDLRKRQNINILFNRATNDMGKADDCASLKKKLYSMDILKLAEKITDIEVDSKEAFPCIYQTKYYDVLSLAKNNAKCFNAHIRALAKSLELSTKEPLPIVVCESDNLLVNGIGRLQVAAEKKKKIIKCVTVDTLRKQLASIMLNGLTMDFDINGEYADILRQNAYMRARNTRETDDEGRYAFGCGFFKGIFPNATGRDFYQLKGDALIAWKRKYGEKIVDFGAGKLNNTRTLREAGIFVSAFEPYFLGGLNKVHKEKSIELTNKFLDEVESGVEYSSVFISSVFNSVPFMADRLKIAQIAAALCKPCGKVICWCQSNTCLAFLGKVKRNVDTEGKLSFNLNYEPNIILGDLRSAPKVQKGHTRDEMINIFSSCFAHIVRLDDIHNFWYLEAAKPILNLKRLAEAIDFEFELPYADGSRMGLSKRARAAFEKRLGVKFN